MTPGSPSARLPWIGGVFSAEFPAPHIVASLYARTLSAGPSYWSVIFVTLSESLFILPFTICVTSSLKTFLNLNFLICKIVKKKKF